MMLLSWLDKFLRLFGSSEQRLRWKLHQWRVARDAQRRHRQNIDQHLRYRHKICDHCGSIVDRRAKRCPSCNQPIASWWVIWLGKVCRRMTPESLGMTTSLLLANGLIFILIAFATGDVMGMSSYSAVRFGANYGPYLTVGGEWWRLVTYNFLHVGGLLHIGFNLVALTIIGPIVEEYYGSSRAAVIFVTTGILAGIASHLYSPLAISGGASGAVMGLIGAGMIAGHLEGTLSGKTMRNRLLRWVLLVGLFGFLVPGIDNSAHIGGFLAGILLGFGMATKARLTVRSQHVYRTLAVLAVCLCMLSFLLAYLSGREYPNQVAESEVHSMWAQCRISIDEGQIQDSAIRCEAFARVRLFQEPVSTLLAAQLRADSGDEARAREMLAILGATLGLEDPPRLPGGQLVVVLRNTIEVWMQSED